MLSTRYANACHTESLAPSSSGLGRRPLTAVAWVRIPSGLPDFLCADSRADRWFGFQVGRPLICRESTVPRSELSGGKHASYASAQRAPEPRVHLLVLEVQRH